MVKFWCDLSTYNRGENTVRKKRTVFFNYVGGRTDKSPAQPQIFHHHQKSKYYYYYSTKPGKKKKEKKGVVVCTLWPCNLQ
jgi:hypothetical protein